MPAPGRGQPSKPFTDDELRTALASAASITEAAERLGCHLSRVKVRSRVSAELRGLYRDAKARGMRGRGPVRRMA
jgi:hypothetical protein